MAETQTFSCGALPSLSPKSNLSVKNDTFDRHMLPSDRLDLKLEVKAGDEPGTFEGYGAIFGNRDNDNDIVVKGAFADSLQARMPAMLWQHNMKEPIGRFMDVREDDKGLYVRGKLSMKGKGAEAYELLSMGAMDGLSIGFVTKEATRDAATGTRTIHKADLMEISLVTFPANEMARIESVKAANMIADERAFERFLRSSGFSRNRAKTITAKGFKADMNTSMKGNMMYISDEDVADIVDTLEAKANNIRDRFGNSPTLESKNENLHLVAGPSFFGPVVRVGVTGPGAIKFQFKDVSVRKFSRVEISLEYINEQGQRKVDKFFIPKSVTINLPEGAQEIKMRAKAAGGLIPHRVLVIRS